MTIQIIGAGFGRTGTKSLQIALGQLGFGPCYHGTEVFAHPEHAPTWIDALNGKAVDWAKLLQGYQAIVDWPGCALYEDLMAAFPNAKVILTLRDPDQWYASVRQTLYQTHLTNAPALLAHSPGRQTVTALFEQVIWQRTFAEQFADRHAALAVYHQHIAQVQQRVPPERLLLYQVQDGWAPLCQFLHISIPHDQPFPHSNTTATFQQMIAQDRQHLQEMAAPPLFQANPKAPPPRPTP